MVLTMFIAAFVGVVHGLRGSIFGYANETFASLSSTKTAKGPFQLPWGYRQGGLGTHQTFPGK